MLIEGYHVRADVGSPYLVNLLFIVTEGRLSLPAAPTSWLGKISYCRRKPRMVNSSSSPGAMEISMRSAGGLFVNSTVALQWVPAGFVGPGWRRFSPSMVTRALPNSWLPESLIPAPTGGTPAPARRVHSFPSSSCGGTWVFDHRPSGARPANRCRSP